jgi:glycosyltransferase involved in cell wall biosynthesis
VRTSNLEGVGGYALELLPELLKIDTENEYFLFFEPDERPNYFKKRVDLSRFKNVEIKVAPLPLGRLKTNIFSLPRFLKENRIDIYHVPNIVFSPFKSGYKIIATVYDLLPFLYPRVAIRDCPLLSFIYKSRAFASFIINKADYIVASSRHSAMYLSHEFKFPIERTRLIYPGVSDKMRRVTDLKELAPLKRKYSLPDNYVLYMGELGSHVNIPALVAAYGMLPEALRAKHKLVIIGRGEKLRRDLDKITRSKVALHDIVMPGYIFPDDKAAIYSMAAAFVSPTLYEGFPLLILEAMACGVPVAASAVPCLDEFLFDAALRFDPKDPKSIAASIESILTDSSLRSDLAQKGRLMSSKFSWQTTAKSILDLYKEVQK